MGRTLQEATGKAAWEMQAVACPAQRCGWKGEWTLRDKRWSSSKASTGPGTGFSACVAEPLTALGASLITVPVSEIRKMKLQRLRNALKTIQ